MHLEECISFKGGRNVESTITSSIHSVNLNGTEALSNQLVQSWDVEKTSNWFQVFHHWNKWQHVLKTHFSSNSGLWICCVDNMGVKYQTPLHMYLKSQLNMQFLLLLVCYLLVSTDSKVSLVKWMFLKPKTAFNLVIPQLLLVWLSTLWELSLLLTTDFTLKWSTKEMLGKKKSSF